jgi:hypothetical protein
MSSDFSEPKNQDTPERVADGIWQQVEETLKSLPLDESACKEKIIADLEAGMSPRDAAASLMRDISARPSHYLDFPNIGGFAPPSCFSRGNVCLSMISR